MRYALLAVALVAAAPVRTAHAQDRTQIEVPLAVAAATAKATVQRAFARDGLAITDASGDVVTGTYTDGFLTVRIRGTVIPAHSTSASVVLTGFGSTPAAGAFPAAEMQVSTNTRKMGKKGKKAWARMERIAAALSADSTAGR